MFSNVQFSISLLEFLVKKKEHFVVGVSASSKEEMKGR
jgi:hypothetical protein